MANYENRLFLEERIIKYEDRLFQRKEWQTMKTDF